MSDLDTAKKRILERVPLPTLIGETIQLQRRSNLHVGLCPFHEEKTPSFTVYADHYFCYSCRVSGDAISFVRHQHGLSYVQALRFLAQKYTVPVPELEESAQERRRRDEESVLRRIMDAAQDFFYGNLRLPVGKGAYDYLANRGFSPATIDDFGFGFALDAPERLLQALRSRGFRPSDVAACSLAGQGGASGRLYDFFQNRVMVPIRDPYGRIIAYGGRTMGDDPAKYKNSRETRLFDKSSTLFGFDRARHAMRQRRRAVVVEGYMDTLQLWQHGFGEVVACMGTALTPQHLRLITNQTNQLVLLFDGDQAGRNASLRAVEAVLAEPSLDVRVALLPNQEDPDTFVQHNGAEALTELLAKAAPLLDHAITAQLAKATGLAVPVMVEQEFVPWLSRVSSPVQRGFLISKVAQYSGVDASTIQRLLGAAGRKPPSPATPPEPSAPKRVAPAPLGKLEHELIGHLYFAKPGEIDAGSLKTTLQTGFNLDEEWQSFASELLESLEQGLAPAEAEPHSFKSSASRHVLALIDRLRLERAAYDRGDAATRVGKVLAEHQRKDLTGKLAMLKSQVTRAFAANDKTEYERLMKVLSQLNRDLVLIEQQLRQG